MKYIVVDARTNDMFCKEFETKEEAISYADIEFAKMSKIDKDACSAYYVLESENPDEDAENHFDGNEIKNYKEN